jgi:hypothetical protein
VTPRTSASPKPAQPSSTVRSTTTTPTVRESAVNPSVVAAANFTESLNENSIKAPLSEDQGFLVTVASDYRNHPSFQAVVFIETVQFVTPENDDWNSIRSGLTQNASTSARTLAPPIFWRVQVWQVTVFNPAWQRSARVPVASKT